MAKVVTFGELMMRIQPADYYRFVQADTMTTTFGGSEANVAVSLANFGHDSCYVSKLPSHEIGQAALNSLRRYGVNTSFILRGGERLGIYFNERGASQRPSKCIYDRKGSSIQTAMPDEFDWKKILDGASWLHLSGITPALGDNMIQACKDAVSEAKKNNIPVSFDINYRSKLWSREKAGEVLSELCRNVDVCISNEEDAYDVFGIKSEGSDTETGNLNNDGYLYVAKALKEKFGFKKVAVTLRSSHDANRNTWQALLYSDQNDFAFSRSYELYVVDRLGGGDSFSAGLIHSLLKGMNTKDTVEWAAAASALKHSIIGDVNLVSEAEVSSLAHGNATGRIQR